MVDWLSKILYPESFPVLHDHAVPVCDWLLVVRWRGSHCQHIVTRLLVVRMTRKAVSIILYNCLFLINPVLLRLKLAMFNVLDVLVIADVWLLFTTDSQIIIIIIIRKSISLVISATCSTFLYMIMFVSFYWVFSILFYFIVFYYFWEDLQHMLSNWWGSHSQHSLVPPVSLTASPVTPHANCSGVHSSREAPSLVSMDTSCAPEQKRDWR